MKKRRYLEIEMEVMQAHEKAAEIEIKTQRKKLQRERSR